MSPTVVIQKNWQALIKPKQLAVEHGDDPKRVAPPSPNRSSAASG